MSFMSRFMNAKMSIRAGKKMKPKNERDSTPVTYQTARALPYLPKERPLSRGAWWFDGPNLTGCILMAKPKTGSKAESRLPDAQHPTVPVSADTQAVANPGYWHSGLLQRSSNAHADTAMEVEPDLSMSEPFIRGAQHSNLSRGSSRRQHTSDQPQSTTGIKEARNTRKCCSLDNNPVAHEDAAPDCCPPTSNPDIIITDADEETRVESAPSMCSIDAPQTSPPPEIILPPSARLPRGLIIFSKAQRNLKKFHKGFDYPGAILSAYNITKMDWSAFCDAMEAPLRDHTHHLDLRRIVDDVLDIVSEWDRNVFRPKGLIMRVDMPGEAKYGLTFMDCYHKGHIDNCSGILTRKVLNYEDSKHNKLDKRDKHLSRVLERGYCSTRIVIDELGILKNERVADERGWIKWNQISSRARTIPPPGKQNVSRVEMGVPFDDRWPHSKHIYYERYRGVANIVTTGGGEYQRSVFIWHPSHDSLDQRHGEYMLANRAVLPADCLPEQGIQRDHLVYWEKWAIDILMKDGYYGRDANNLPACFSKRLPSAIQPLHSAYTTVPFARSGEENRSSAPLKITESDRQERMKRSQEAAQRQGRAALIAHATLRAM